MPASRETCLQSEPFYTRSDVLRAYDMLRPRSHELEMEARESKREEATVDNPTATPLMHASNNTDENTQPPKAEPLEWFVNRWQECL